MELVKHYRSEVIERHIGHILILRPNIELSILGEFGLIDRSRVAGGGYAVDFCSVGRGFEQSWRLRCDYALRQA